MANGLGLAGLAGIVVCVGHLAGAWWGGLLASALLVGIAYVQHVNETTSPQSGPPAADEEGSSE